MEYREIVAVTGLSGLYQLMATKSDGAIVKNLADKTTKFIYALLNNVTPLEIIEVYTTDDNVRLHNVFEKMKDTAATTPIIDHKKADNNAIKAYFKSIFPEFDEERVYVSDMKKMLKWYEILNANNLLNFEALNAAAPAAEAVEAAPAEEEAPAKKATKKAVAAEATEGEEKPAKKARAKKAVAETAEGETAPAKKTARKKKTEE